MKYFKTLTIRQELLTAAFSLFVILCCAVIYGGKNADPEALAYVPDFLRNLPLVQRVYDINANDYGTFRARELSYFFNIIDANLLLTSYKFGLVRFCSFFHLIVIFVIGMVHLRFTQIYFPRVNSLLRLMPVLLFATAPAAFAGCGFFRTSKVLVALGVTVLAWELYGISGKAAQQKISVPKLFGLSAFSVAVTLCDEQGVFLILALFGVTALGLFFRRSIARIQILCCFGLSIALHAFYRFYLGIWMMERFGGKPLDPMLQVSPSYVDIFSFWEKLDDASDFILGTLKFMMGNMWIVAGIFCLLFLWKYRKGKSSPESIVLFGAVVIIMWSMTILMIGRHPHMMGIDVRRVYYVIPIATLILFGISILVNSLALLDSRTERRLSGLLCFCFLANLIAIPSHQAALNSNGFRLYSRESHEVTACLKADGDYRIPRLSAEDDKGQAYCDLFRARAGKKSL